MQDVYLIATNVLRWKTNILRGMRIINIHAVLIMLIVSKTHPYSLQIKLYKQVF